QLIKAFLLLQFIHYFVAKPSLLVGAEQPKMDEEDRSQIHGNRRLNMRCTGKSLVRFLVISMHTLKFLWTNRHSEDSSALEPRSYTKDNGAPSRTPVSSLPPLGAPPVMPFDQLNFIHVIHDMGLAVDSYEHGTAHV